MKKLLLLAATAAMVTSVNAQYKVEKLWGSEDVPVAADCRQGVGLNGKFYINDKAVNADEGTEPKVLVYGENGLENQQFPGGPNCGINIDQAGHLIVSLATFPEGNSWFFDDATPMIRVIDPATAEVTDLPLGGGAPNNGRLDVLGRAYGNLLEVGELYLPGLPADQSLRRHFYENGEVLGEDCYSPILNPGPGADNMTTINAVVDADGNDAIFYYQRGGNPFLYYFNGDNLEGEQIAIPTTADGIMRCNQNGANFFAFNGKNFVVYPCGKANNAYYDGFAIYEIGAEAPLFVKQPTIAAAPNGFQANWLNAEVTEDGVIIYQYVPGKSMEVYKMTLEQEEQGIDEFYVVGSFNGWNWQNPEGRIPMEEVEGGYAATLDLSAEDEFKIITPAEDGGWTWFGGVDANQVGYFLITEELLENGIALIDGANFRIQNAGNYTITIKEAPTTFNGIKAPFVMEVKQNDTHTAVTDIETAKAQDNTWYNIQGMKINGVPTAAGIYINAGRKVVIK